MAIAVEDSLWILLAGAVPFFLPSIDNGDGVWHWEAWMVLCASVGSVVLSNPFSPAHRTSGNRTRTRRTKHLGGGERGATMSIVLVPVLLRVLAHYSSGAAGSDPQARGCWTTYAKITAILVLPFPTAVTAVLYVPAVVLDPSIGNPIAGLFFVAWFLVLPRIATSGVAKSFAFGEWRVVCLLLLVAVSEYAGAMSAAASERFRSRFTHRHETHHVGTTASSLWPMVALSGSLSCCAFACLGSSLRERLSWWWRIGLNVLGPLLVVDATLYVCTTPGAAAFESTPYHDHYGKFFPLLSIRWLVDFLVEKENDTERFWGLVYWVCVLVASSVPTLAILSMASPNKTGKTDAQKIQRQTTAPKRKPKPSVVVTRKWFHLVAVILFGPITLRLPQLMSLSYAIAASILLVLETMRGDEAPVLQAFYTAFLDDRKDSGDQVIVSHLFLIVGCAIPLWIGQVLDALIAGAPSADAIAIANADGEAENALLLEQHFSVLLLLAEFGVLCIGVGDAMGAVVGKSFGTHKWGRNQRTLEGSLAMWSSMVAIGSAVLCCTSGHGFGALVVASTLTTVLEAFTMQLDNLVLPLFGSCVILLLSAPPLPYYGYV